jgi:hypothetical protein
MMVYNNSREVQPDLNGGNELYEEKKKWFNIKFIFGLFYFFFYLTWFYYLLNIISEKR